MLDLVWPAYLPVLHRLNTKIDCVDAERHWVYYHGAIPYTKLHTMFGEVDMDIWASSCETFEIILLEDMASGLPLACSNKHSMHEIVGEAGVYFEPEQPEDIARALRELIESPPLRNELTQASYDRAQQYSWQRCSDETFGFLAALKQQQKRTIDV